MAGRHVAFALLALAGVLALAPGASAAPFDPTLLVNATFPADALTPFVERPGFPDLSDVRVRFPMRVEMVVPAGYVAGRPTEVTLGAAELPIWVEVDFDPPVFEVDTGAPAATERRFERVVDVVAHATRVAPSGTQGAVELTATARRGPLSVATASTQGVVLARPYAVLDAEVKEHVLEVERFGNATVGIAVTNTGNALVAAVVKVMHADPGLDVKVLNPVPVVFRPNPLGFEPEVGNVAVEVRHRAGAGGEVLLLVTTALPDEGWLVQERAIRLHVDAADTGGPSATLPLLALAGVAGAVFLFRRT